MRMDTARTNTPAGYPVRRSATSAWRVGKWDPKMLGYSWISSAGRFFQGASYRITSGGVGPGCIHTHLDQSIKSIGLAIVLDWCEWWRFGKPERWTFGRAKIWRLFIGHLVSLRARKSMLWFLEIHENAHHGACLFAMFRSSLRYLPKNQA